MVTAGPDEGPGYDDERSSSFPHSTVLEWDLEDRLLHAMETGPLAVADYIARHEAGASMVRQAELEQELHDGYQIVNAAAYKLITSDASTWSTVPNLRRGSSSTTSPRSTDVACTTA